MTAMVAPAFSASMRGGLVEDLCGVVIRDLRQIRSFSASMRGGLVEAAVIQRVFDGSQTVVLRLDERRPR